jgi:hypothetical protein
MTASRKTLSLSAATLLCYMAFAFFRHRQFALNDHDGLSGGVSTILLFAFFPLWALAFIAIFRNRRVMAWPAATFCWIVCGLGGSVIGVFILGLFALVFR